MGWPSDVSWYKLLEEQGSFIGGLFALIAGLFAYFGALRAARMQVTAMRQQMAAAQRSADEQIAIADRQIGEMRAQAAAEERRRADEWRKQRYALALLIRSEQFRVEDEIGEYETALGACHLGPRGRLRRIIVKYPSMMCFEESGAR